MSDFGRALPMQRLRLMGVCRNGPDASPYLRQCHRQYRDRRGAEPAKSRPFSSVNNDWLGDALWR